MPRGQRMLRKNMPAAGLSGNRSAAFPGISKRNNFSKLERSGGECAGAFGLLPQDKPVPLVGETGIREMGELESWSCRINLS